MLLHAVSASSLVPVAGGAQRHHYSGKGHRTVVVSFQVAFFGDLRGQLRKSGLHCRWALRRQCSYAPHGVSKEKNKEPEPEPPNSALTVDEVGPGLRKLKKYIDRREWRPISWIAKKPNHIACEFSLLWRLKNRGAHPPKKKLKASTPRY